MFGDEFIALFHPSREETIEDIVKDFTLMATRLEAHNAAKAEKLDALQIEVITVEKALERGQRVADKLSELLA